MPQQHHQEASDLLAHVQANLAQEWTAAQQTVDGWIAQAQTAGESAGIAQTQPLWEAWQLEQTQRWAMLPEHLLKASIDQARRALQAELSKHPETVLAIVQTALKSVKRATQLQLRVHPSDAALLRPQLALLLESILLSTQVSIQEDRHLERGDVLIHTEAGVIDGRIETQLTTIYRKLQQEKEALTWRASSNK